MAPCRLSLPGGASSLDRMVSKSVFLIHTVFDGAAWAGGFLLGQWTQRHWLAASTSPSFSRHPLYFGAAIAGAAVGAFALGTLNMVVSGAPGLGRSILGALFGAIVGVELYKRIRGVSGSTGLSFVVPLSFGIAVGRIGCLLSGLDDFTYGVPTSLPWGWDFGDGVPRHPVQLYETLSMAAFLTWFLWALARGDSLALRCGFHLFVAVYAAQRFAWEFLKPYEHVAGPFNVFHIACLLLIFYAIAMLRRQGRPDAR
jgi:phosphatidylglycerol---prolipoprotein diacylglyceryl transferase